MENVAIDRVLSGAYYGDKRNVVCPICNDDYTHVIGVSLREALL